MNLKELLASLDKPNGEDSHAGRSNLGWLKSQLEGGYEACSATLLSEGFGSWQGPALLIELARDSERVEMPISLDAATRLYLTETVPQLTVTGLPGSGPATDDESPSRLAGELATLFGKTEDLSPQDRAGRLMDWIMEQVDASRCALIPFESGTPGPPLVFHSRGDRGTDDVRHVPRKVVAHVARTRQPRVSHKVGEVKVPRSPDETAIRQQVRSYMAVPVVFRGDLLAVCYVDRFGQPRRFTEEEQRIFEALAYELAAPLLQLRDDQRRREYRELRDVLLNDSTAAPRVVTSPALEETLDRARKLAPYASENLLILGDTGVGKEVVARYIHEHSDRADKAFIAVNVSAISPELFESELMGSVKGAFTDAVDRDGRIAAADGGTLFLDEIGDLALTNQVKLLRFLQDKTVRSVGGKNSRVVDVRVVAATNRPMLDLVQNGDFREDLYHRFAPPIRVPPLRDRREEIVPHARAWLRSKSRMAGLSESRFEADAEEFLLSYAWPGNVRQLEAVVAHAVLLAGDEAIDRGLLASLVPETKTLRARATTWSEWKDQRDDEEREWLTEVIADHRGRVAAAAKALEVPLSTLRSLLKRLGLKD